MPLNNFIIYNLPAGLWVVALTLLAGDFRLKLSFFYIPISYLPISLGVLIEFFQLIHLTDGTFDFLDICTMIVAAICAFRIKLSDFLFSTPYKNQPILVLAGVVILFLGNS